MVSQHLTTEPVDLPSGRLIARRLGVAGLALAGLAVLVTHLPGLRDIGHQLAGADTGWITVALVLELLSTASFAVVFHGVYDRRPGPRASTSLSLAVQGMNIMLPSGGAGGLAIGAVLLDRAGVPRSFAASRTVALFLITSLVSFAAVVIAGVGVASGALAGDAPLTLTLLPGGLALLVIVVLFALPRSRESAARGSAGRLGKAIASAREYLRNGVGESAELLRSGDRLVIWGAIGYFAFDVAALAAAFHAVGPAGLPIGLLVLAYTLGHGGALIPLPGSAEGGLIGMFVLYGMPVSTATAAVLAYRVLHAGVPVLLGLVGLADVRRQLRRAPGRTAPVRRSSAPRPSPPSHARTRVRPVESTTRRQSTWRARPICCASATSSSLRATSRARSRTG